MIRVKATREGLLGRPTASGYIVDLFVPFVALPSRRAVQERLVIRLFNPATVLSCFAVVMDEGPWNVDDDAYVYGGARPQAESGVDKFGRKTNGAGIDLGEWVWTKLGMTDNGNVVWERVELPWTVPGVTT